MSVLTLITALPPRPAMIGALLVALVAGHDLYARLAPPQGAEQPLADGAELLFVAPAEAVVDLGPWQGEDASAQSPEAQLSAAEQARQQAEADAEAARRPRLLAVFDHHGQRRALVASERAGDPAIPLAEGQRWQQWTITRIHLDAIILTHDDGHTQTLPLFPRGAKLPFAAP